METNININHSRSFFSKENKTFSYIYSFLHEFIYIKHVFLKSSDNKAGPFSIVSCFRIILRFVYYLLKIIRTLIFQQTCGFKVNTNSPEWHKSMTKILKKIKGLYFHLHTFICTVSIIIFLIMVYIWFRRKLLDRRGRRNGIRNGSRRPKQAIEIDGFRERQRR